MEAAKIDRLHEIRSKYDDIWEIPNHNKFETWKKTIQECNEHNEPMINPKLMMKPSVQAWIEYLPNEENCTEGLIRCRICSRFRKELHLNTRGTSLARPNGVLFANYKLNNAAINRHATEHTHIHTVDQVKLMSINMKNSKLEELVSETPQHTITNHHMMAVYTGTMIRIHRTLSTIVCHDTTLIQQWHLMFYGS